MCLIVLTDTEDTLITEEELAVYVVQQQNIQGKTESEAVAEYVESLIQGKKMSEC